jgi:hypothetical protein
MKNFKRKTSAYFLLIALVCSCQTNDKENINESNERFNVINNARVWYENNTQNDSKAIGLRYASTESKTNVMPNWQQAFRRQNKDIKVVEAALIWDVRISMATMDCYEAYQKTEDNRYIRSLTRLVILTDRNTDETQGFFTCIMPNREYWEKTNFKPFKDITYLDKKDFSGQILTLDMDGKLLSCDMYKDGNLTDSFDNNSNKQGAKNNSMLRAGWNQCVYVAVYKDNPYCKTWDAEGEPAEPCDQIFSHWEEVWCPPA